MANVCALLHCLDLFGLQSDSDIMYGDIVSVGLQWRDTIMFSNVMYAESQGSREIVKWRWIVSYCAASSISGKTSKHCASLNLISRNASILLPNCSSKSLFIRYVNRYSMAVLSCQPSQQQMHYSAACAGQAQSHYTLHSHMSHYIAPQWKIHSLWCGLSSEIFDHLFSLVSGGWSFEYR